jgi:hypothetical protein
MTMADVTTTYSSTDVCMAAHISYRVLDYWVRTGAVTPSVDVGHGSGRPRVWSEDDLCVMVALGRVWRDLNRLELQMNTLLVEQLWKQLRENGSAMIALDTVMIGVSCE